MSVGVAGQSVQLQLFIALIFIALTIKVKITD